MTHAHRCGDYELLGTLARGGMAELLLARPTTDAGYLVVIKRALPEFARERDFQRMLLDEARIAASLHHGNVVRVHAVGDQAGVPYLVMELLLGEDLNRVLWRTTQLGCLLPVELALEITMAICAGLHHAHERRDQDGALLDLVHRDVSPQNVFLTYDGGIKVLDFGIARTAEMHGRTRTGIVKGKVAYMSPEQAHGRALDRRSDIFSVGILLWEMTTGQRLYARQSELETLKAVCDDAPRPSTVVAGYPAALEEIVMGCLARDPQKRWPTCQVLADQLEVCAREHALKSVPRSIETLMRALFTHDVVAYTMASRSATQLAAFALTRARAFPSMATVLEPSYEEVSVELSPPPSPPTAPRPRRRRSMIAAAVLAAGATCVAMLARREAVDDVAAAARPASEPMPALSESRPSPIITPIDPPPERLIERVSEPPVEKPTERPTERPIDVAAKRPTRPSVPSKPHKPSTSVTRRDAAVQPRAPVATAPPEVVPPTSPDVPVNDRIPIIAPPACSGDSPCASP